LADIYLVSLSICLLLEQTKEFRNTLQSGDRFGGIYHVGDTVG